MNVALPLAVASLVFVSTAEAQPSDVFTTMNLVFGPPSYAGCGDPVYDYDRLGRECSDLPQGSTAIPQLAVFVVVNRRGGFVDGIGGARFGWTHDIDMAGDWTLCTGGSEAPGRAWPASGSGNSVTWAGECYQPAGETARIGFDAAFGPLAGGQLALTGDPRVDASQARRSDCSGVEVVVPGFNLAGGTIDDFGLPIVCSPSPPIPLMERTWRDVKTHF